MEAMGEPEAGAEPLPLHPGAPPSTDEQSGYRGHDGLIRVVAVAAIVWGCVYLLWRLIDTHEGAQPELFALLYVCEIFGWLMLSSFAFLAWRIPLPVRPLLGGRPSVDIYVCTYNEDLDVLTATLVGCDRVTYPHTTWLLDDGRRDEVRALAERFGVRYLTRSTNEHAKAGNINNALSQTHGELLLMFDADHVPQPDILDILVGYFDDPEVALVQTPHDFENLDSFQHFSNRRHDQSIFFEVIMPGKDRHNGVFWCGSAALIRREALESIGGVATETIAEDFHTTIRMHRDGWRTHYHDETLVQGLAPHDLAGFLLQRDRWARGNLAVLRTKENPLTVKGLTMKQRSSYLASLAAYFVPMQRLGMLFVLVVMLLTGLLPVHAPLWQFAVFWLPWILLDLGASTLLARGEANVYDDAYVHSLTTEIYVRAALSIIRPIKGAFKVTPKNGIDGGGWQALRQLRIILAVEVVVFAALAARLLSLAGVVHLHPLSGVALGAGIFFAVWELSLMGSALWRVTHRHQVRRKYRVGVEITGVLDGGVVRVVDLTERGAGIVAPHQIELGEEVGLQLNVPTVDGSVEHIQVNFEVRSCWKQDGSGWRLGGTIDPSTERDNELLVEHCHVVSTRDRLIAAGRLLGHKHMAPAADPSRSEDPPLASHG